MAEMSGDIPGRSALVRLCLRLLGLFALGLTLPSAGRALAASLHGAELDHSVLIPALLLLAAFYLAAGGTWPLRPFFSRKLRHG
ncbi:MAG TPA: hypothetical protein VD963_06765 [Phycisphaerales bacterium]|nr:hypothetical protein [Phycisphaerales bacterium]